MWNVVARIEDQLTFKILNMKIIFPVTILIFIFSFSFAQNPTPLRPDIQVNLVKSAPHFCSGIAQDPVSQELHYVRFNGEIFKLTIPVAGPATDTLLFDVNDHGITMAKGIMFVDSMLFVIGNNLIDTSTNIGFIMRGDLQPNGSRIWSTVMETEPYPQSFTAFDHGISGLCLSPGGDSIYFNSGSRTDHGEEHTNGGLFPGAREVPITSAIFRIPLMAQNLTLQNDSTFLAPYLFADGTRNTFDMAFNNMGHLIGCENSGDRDDPDEINWLREGMHYGFPWNMGGNANPQQFPGYDPTTDFMINQAHQSYALGYFYNDPSFPQQPVNLILTDPLQNTGPDGDKYRDTVSGTLLDASDLGLTLGTLTSHRSPLGLVMDLDSLLVQDLKGDAFILGNQKGGDSLGNVPGGGLGTLLETGEDLMSVKMNYDLVADSYELQCTRIVEGFTRPVDACLIGNKLYVLEYGRPIAPGSIWEIVLPLDISSLEETEETNLTIYPNPSSGIVNIDYFPLSKTSEIIIYNGSGQVIYWRVFQNDFSGTRKTARIAIKEKGNFLVRLKTGDKSYQTRFIIPGQ
jgi:hypothetical protein